MPFKAASYQRQLEEAGIDHKHAQAHAMAMESFVVSELATRDDLERMFAEWKAEAVRLDAKIDKLAAETKQMAARLDAKIDKLAGETKQMEVRLEAKIGAMEVRLIRWLVGTIAGSMGLLLALLRLTS